MIAHKVIHTEILQMVFLYTSKPQIIETTLLQSCFVDLSSAYQQTITLDVVALQIDYNNPFSIRKGSYKESLSAPGENYATTGYDAQVETPETKLPYQFKALTALRTEPFNSHSEKVSQKHTYHTCSCLTPS